MKKIIFSLIMMFLISGINLISDDCCPEGFSPGANEVEYQINDNCFVVINYCLSDADNLETYAVPSVYICSVTYYGSDCIEYTNPPTPKSIDWDTVVALIVQWNAARFSYIRDCENSSDWVRTYFRVYNGGCYRYSSGFSEKGEYHKFIKCPSSTNLLYQCRQEYKICYRVVNGVPKMEITAGPIDNTWFECDPTQVGCEKQCF